MSSTNEQLARHVIEQWQAHGLDGILPFVHEDVEYLPTDEQPIQGRIALERYYARWLEPWEDYSVHATEYMDAGDNLIVGMVVRGRGRSSGIEVGMEFWNVLTFADGQATRWSEHLDRADALRTAGLAE